jgi:ketosteroid isomerase-like protein
MRTVSLYLGAAALVLSTSAFADAAADAQHHFKAIASGSIDNIMVAYSDNAYFEWVGGPLNGSYVGTKPIREVWAKFAKANAPLEVKVTKLEESGNTAGATVTANVEFKGKKPIKVRYVLLYRDGKLADEVWQIDPKLDFARY